MQAPLDNPTQLQYHLELCIAITASEVSRTVGAEKPATVSYLTHYVIVRADLPVGVQIAQTIHAAGYSSPGNIPDGTYAVALTCRDEAELRALADRLEKEGLPRHLIVEADAPYDGQAMAIGIPPMDRKTLKPILQKLPLLK